MASKGIKIVMGGAGSFGLKPAPLIPQILDVLQANEVTDVDTAIIYGSSEENLGLVNAGERFTIHTKLPGGLKAGSGTKDGVLKDGHESLARLKMKQVDILYLHSPDESVPIEETLSGLNQLYSEGVFRRFGLSNFKPDQVQKVYDVCEAKGYVKPSVYQGNYNAFARSYEDELLPLLRKFGMSFYAYSPQAGGFLSKSREILDKDGEGRIQSQGQIGDMYRAMYKKPTLLEGLKKWNEIAMDAGVEPSALAVRWVRSNSALKSEYGDAIIIGGRTVEQVEQGLRALDQGPLGESVAKKIDEVWRLVKDEAPVDNYHDFIKQ